MKSRADAVAAVRAKIRLLHYALSTEDSYCGWVGRYYDFCRGLPPQLSPEKKAEAFLTDLAVRQHVAAKTQNQAFAALLFLYGQVLGRPLADVDALRAKQPAHERTAPSRDQIREDPHHEWTLIDTNRSRKRPTGLVSIRVNSW